MIRKSLYWLFIGNATVRLLNQPIFAMIIPPMIGLYYLTLDVWGDKWDIIKNHEEMHAIAFTIFVIVTGLGFFIQGINGQYLKKNGKDKDRILDGFILFVNGLVKKKRDRFYKKAKNIKRKGDTFNQITEPKEQIVAAMSGINRFFTEGFGVNSKNIETTVIKGIESEDKWWFEFSCDTQRQYTKPKVLIKENSSALYCKTTGESIFVSDLRKGIKEGVFFPSERSKSSANIGSCYCRPVRVTLPDEEHLYIFTVVVYGQFLCTPYDQEECKAVEKILDEIGDRIELELYLHSMKTYKGGRVA